MGWDRKKRGSKSGYFYLSTRTPAGTKKTYFGRKSAGHAAAAMVEQRKQARKAATKAIENDRNATAEADLLADELQEWAKVVSTAWLLLTNHRCHHGCWRKKRGKKAI